MIVCLSVRGRCPCGHASTHARTRSSVCVGTGSDMLAGSRDCCVQGSSFLLVLVSDGCQPLLGKVGLALTQLPRCIAVVDNTPHIEMVAALCAHLVQNSHRLCPAYAPALHEACQQRFVSGVGHVPFATEVVVALWLLQHLPDLLRSQAHHVGHMLLRDTSFPRERSGIGLQNAGLERVLKDLRANPLTFPPAAGKQHGRAHARYCLKGLPLLGKGHERCHAGAHCHHNDRRFWCWWKGERGRLRRHKDIAPHTQTVQVARCKTLETPSSHKANAELSDRRIHGVGASVLCPLLRLFPLCFASATLLCRSPSPKGGEGASGEQGLK
mmetsp:Transcript_30061/g.69928  ORF Transcript_30061/g.69928 Transcript_30061/m.69928 type:complete len:326 (-) Transcript_30061:88-1065(-)